MTRTSGKTQVPGEVSSGISFKSDFIEEDFRSALRDKGYDILHETALICPCKSRPSDHQSNCDNCGGSGWVFTNPTKTRAILTSMRIDRQYDEEARRDLGLMYVTLQPSDKMGHMDKIIVLDAESIQTKVLYLQEKDSGQFFAMTPYDITLVEYAGLFLGETIALQRLIEGTDFTIQDNKFLLDPSFNIVTGSATSTGTSTTLVDTAATFTKSGIDISDVIRNVTDGSSAIVSKITDDNNIVTTALTGGTLNVWTSADVWEVDVKPQVTLRYRHRPVFHIWDIIRDARTSKVVGQRNDVSSITLPMIGIGKRAHLISDAENFAGNRLFDNSWEPVAPSVTTAFERVIRGATTQSIFDAMTAVQKIEMKVLNCP